MAIIIESEHENSESHEKVTNFDQKNVESENESSESKDIYINDSSKKGRFTPMEQKKLTQTVG